jgi:hypothetical protein
MGKLIIHNHYKEQDKNKREQVILELVISMIMKKNS